MLANGSLVWSRFAAVSDIHGNMPALEAVINDIERLGISDVVALGDHVSGPLWPNETAEKLAMLGWPALAGNHERQLLEWPLERMGATDAFAARALVPAMREWLASLPQLLRLRADVLLCHGTPADDNRYWLHRGRRGSMREATNVEVAEHAEAFALTLCGHTHLPRAVFLSDGRIIANGGSVGLPAYELGLPSYQCKPAEEPQARYLVAEFTSDGWAIDLRAVSYDFDYAARKAEKEGRVNWVQALRTGMVE